MKALRTIDKTICARGKSFASFGELIQGRKSNGTDFLVSMPINLWSVCEIDVIPKPGPLLVNCSYEKSKRVAELAAKEIGVKEGFEIKLSLSRNIPIGKGLSSSTADMLATIRGLEEYFSFSFNPKKISEIFHQIEPHEGLMYNTSVIYNHRNGILLNKLDYTPNFKIIYLDFGGIVDSIGYNRNLSFSSVMTRQYDILYNNCVDAFKNKDDVEIANCAVQSLSLSLEVREDPLRRLALENFKSFKAMGVINTHSGTCIGFVYSKEYSDEEFITSAEKISEFYNLPVQIISGI